MHNISLFKLHAKKKMEICGDCQACKYHKDEGHTNLEAVMSVTVRYNMNIFNVDL